MNTLGCVDCEEGCQAMKKTRTEFNIFQGKATGVGKMKSKQTRFGNGQRFIATFLVALMVVLVPRVSMATVDVTLNLSMSAEGAAGWRKLLEEQQAKQQAYLQAIYAYLHQSITVTPADIDGYVRAGKVDRLYELLYTDATSYVPIREEQLATHSFADYYHASCSKRERNLIIDSEFTVSERMDINLEPQSPFTPYHHNYVDDGLMSIVFSGTIYPCENGIFGDYKERSAFDLVVDEPIKVHREITTYMNPVFKYSSDSVSGNPEVVLTVQSVVNTRITKSETLYDALHAVHPVNGTFNVEDLEDVVFGDLLGDLESKALVLALQQAVRNSVETQMTIAVAQEIAREIVEQIVGELIANAAVAVVEAISVVLFWAGIINLVALVIDWGRLHDVDDEIEDRVKAYVKADLVKAYDDFFIPSSLEHLPAPYNRTVNWAETRVILPKGEVLKNDVLRPLLYSQEAGGMLCSDSVRVNPEAVLMLYMTGVTPFTDAIEQQEKGCVSAVITASTALML